MAQTTHICLRSPPQLLHPSKTYPYNVIELPRSRGWVQPHDFCVEEKPATALSDTIAVDTHHIRCARRGRPTKADPPPTEAGYRLGVVVQPLPKPEDATGGTMLTTAVNTEHGMDAEIPQADKD